MPNQLIRPQWRNIANNYFDQWSVGGGAKVVDAVLTYVTDGIGKAGPENGMGSWTSSTSGVRKIRTGAARTPSWTGRAANTTTPATIAPEAPQNVGFISRILKPRAGVEGLFRTYPPAIAEIARYWPPRAVCHR